MSGSPSPSSSSRNSTPPRSWPSIAAQVRRGWEGAAWISGGVWVGYQVSRVSASRMWNQRWDFQVGSRGWWARGEGGFWYHQSITSDNLENLNKNSNISPLCRSIWDNCIDSLTAEISPWYDSQRPLSYGQKIVLFQVYYFPFSSLDFSPAGCFCLKQSPAAVLFAQLLLWPSCEPEGRFQLSFTLSSPCLFLN